MRFIGTISVACAAILLGSSSGSAVVMGSSSSLGYAMVRLIGSSNCSGVVIARQLVATAAHCASRRMRVYANGHALRIAGVSRSATLDDGRRVQVSGDAAILRLASPLPSSVSPAPIGAGNGDRFTIAGYGTTDESTRGAFGGLHEASLVAAGARVLVDPGRTGSISASACFGDSGGAVFRGSDLVGIITRAAYPKRRIACGYLTRWAPIFVRGEPRPKITAARRQTDKTSGSNVSQVASFSLFDQSSPQDQPARRSKRKRRARQ